MYSVIVTKNQQEPSNQLADYSRGLSRLTSDFIQWFSYAVKAWGKAILVALVVIGGWAAFWLVHNYGWPTRHNAVVSSAVAAVGATEWHRAGYRGEGVRVGIIATDFNRVRRVAGRELPSESEYGLKSVGFPADVEDGSGRGTAAAEVLHDLAPDAELGFVVCQPTARSLARAINSMSSFRADVVLVLIDLNDVSEGLANLQSASERMEKYDRLVVAPACEAPAQSLACFADLLSVGAVAGDPAQRMGASGGLGVRLGDSVPDVVALGGAATVTLGSRPRDAARTLYGFSGTDVAAAHAAGVAALMRQAYPELTVDDVVELIEKSATDLGEPGDDETYGAGLIHLPPLPEAEASGS